ncbi:hypothetical protein ABN028_24700 [Actinopolymorpha sp. B17G11]|uniref:hypothetical protein n=1 Tax=Actinopolymorpha sp. B17G11 TaxID=3160861 RepID=UPI0032E48C3F
MSESTPNPHNDNPAGLSADDVGDVVAARAFRLMAAYEHLRMAVDWMSAEASAQRALLAATGDCEEARFVMADTAQMIAAIAAERDHAAEVVAALVGEHTFKTGEVHQAFYRTVGDITGIDVSRKVG